MSRSLCSPNAATPVPPRRGTCRRPVGIALCLVLGASLTARGASYDSYAQPRGGFISGSDGMSSVVVGSPPDAVASEVVADGSTWTVTDGSGEPAIVSEDPTGWQPGPCEMTCPPWNGVPGLVNRCLGNACPRVVFSADALMLWQGNVASRPLFTDPAAEMSVLNVDQIRPPVSVGPRLDLILNITQCHGIEANWFDVQNFEGTREIPQGMSQYAMNNIAGMTFADIDTAVIGQTAAFKSFELNWRRRTCTPFTWLAGFRWAEWDQSLTTLDTYTDVTAASGVDAASVVTGNNLWGGQVGVDALLWNTGGRLTFNGVAKAGAFYNYQAFQRTELLGDRQFGNFSAAANGTAFLGEVGVNGTVQICSWLYWRAGYNFFWLSGVAVPAAQLSITNQPEPPTTALNHAGSVFLHGVNTGLEARW